MSPTQIGTNKIFEIVSCLIEFPDILIFFISYSGPRVVDLAPLI